MKSMRPVDPRLRKLPRGTSITTSSSWNTPFPPSAGSMLGYSYARLPARNQGSDTMAKVTMETKLAASPEMLWNTIGGFNALPGWHPAVSKSESTGETKGSTRTLSLVGGGSIVERLEEVSATERVYRYSIVSGPLPVANYAADIR